MIAILLPFLHQTIHNEQSHKITLSVVDTPIVHFPCHHEPRGLYETCTKRLELRNTPHLSGGCGLKVAMNENFVISADWATAFDKQDNSKFNNLYIKMGYMF